MRGTTILLSGAMLLAAAACSADGGRPVVLTDELDRLGANAVAARLELGTHGSQVAQAASLDAIAREELEHASRLAELLDEMGDAIAAETLRHVETVSGTETVAACRAEEPRHHARMDRLLDRMLDLRRDLLDDGGRWHEAPSDGAGPGVAMQP